MKKKEPSLRITDASLSLRRKHSWFLPVTEGIVLLLFSAGILFTLQSGVQLPVNAAVFAAAALLPLLLTGLFHLPRFRGLSLLGLLGAEGIALWFYRRELAWGAELFRVGFIESLNEYLNTNLVAPSLALSQGSRETAAAVLLIPLMTLFLILAGYAVIRGRSFLSLLLLEAPVLWMAVNLADAPLSLPLFCMALSLMMALLMGASVIPRKRKDPQGDFSLPYRKRGKRIRRAVSFRYQVEGAARGGRSALLMGAALLLTITAVFPRESYVRSQTLQEMDRDPAAFFRDNSFFDLLESRAGGGISGGKLGTADRISYTDEPAFRIYNLKNQAPMYLKGYVGSVYNGSGWSDLPDSDYDGISSLFNGRDNPQVYGSADWLGEDYLQIAGGSDEIAHNYSLAIEMLGMDKRYLLTPYGFGGSFSVPAGNYRFDRSIDGEGVDKRYLVDAIFWHESGERITSTGQTLGGIHQSAVGLESQFQTYCQETGSGKYDQQQSYGEFVKKYYTQLPEGKLSQIKEDYSPDKLSEELKWESSQRIPSGQSLSFHFDDLKKGFVMRALDGRTSEYKMGPDGNVLVTTSMDEAQRIVSLARKIRSDLAAAAAYDLAPGRTPFGKDFAEYFLYENRRGYCTHFATAATLMFRAAGIPARYAEGYVITSKDYQKMKNASLTITDRNAHAWTEVYLEPFGWVPVETTPGFSVQQTAPPVYEVSSVPESVSSSEEASAELVSEGGSSEAGAVSSGAEGLFSDAASQPEESAAGSGGGSSEETTTSGSAEPSVPDEEKPPPQGMTQEEYTRPFWILLSVLLLLLAGILFILARRAVVLEHRKRAFAQTDTNQAAAAIYRYCLAVWKVLGKAPGTNQEPMEWAHSLMQGRRLPEEWGDFERVTALALAAKFSPRPITPEERNEMAVAASKLSRQAYCVLKAPQRFVFRWIMALR